MTVFRLDPTLGGSFGSSGQCCGSILFYRCPSIPDRRILFATVRGTHWIGCPGQAGSHD